MDYCNNNELLSKMGSSLSSSVHQFEILTRSWNDRWPRSNNWHCAKLDKVRVDDSISLPITSWNRMKQSLPKLMDGFLADNNRICPMVVTGAIIDHCQLLQWKRLLTLARRPARGHLSSGIMGNQVVDVVISSPMRRWWFVKSSVGVVSGVTRCCVLLR
jgi:hypothetical protein